MEADLDIDRVTSFTFGQSTPPLSSEEMRRILDYLKQAEVSEQAALLYRILLYDFFYVQQTLEIETPTIEIPFDYRRFYNLSNIISPWLKKEKEPKELEQEALLAIASEFSQIKKVQSIYVQKYREELQSQILLSIIQYDNDLMDALLDIEYDIRRGYPEVVFEFFYPPAEISDKKDFVHPQAHCIYSR